MRFSVLVPVYNVGDFLEARVRSVLRQTERDFELVLADDGSTDGSGEACDRFTAQNPEIVRVAHQPDKGLILTRRSGTHILLKKIQPDAILNKRKGLLDALGVFGRLQRKAKYGA